jgi:1,3-beta-glucanosyltransferase GAS1
VVDAFQKYDNTLGFFIGNEIITLKNQSMVTPFIKAATRDIKAYINNKGYRSIPVGYSAADIAELRPMLQDYLTCGGNTSENIDFFSLNSYEWCGLTTYQDSGYANLQNMSVNFPVPIFFSETGCIKPPPRLFADQAAIFGPEMVDTWSGAIIYEWIQETNEYGLISYAAPLAPTATGSNIADGFLRKGTPTPILPDFTNLKSQWATLTPTGIAQSAYNAQQSVSTRPCPMSTPGGWLVNGNVALPSLGQTLTGSYSSAPTVDPNMVATSSGSSAQPSSTSSKDAASANRELAGMSAGLASVFIFFTLWL